MPLISRKIPPHLRSEVDNNLPWADLNGNDCSIRRQIRQLQLWVIYRPLIFARFSAQLVTLLSLETISGPRFLSTLRRENEATGSPLKGLKYST